MTQAVELIRTPAGSPAWHVVGHPEAKALLANDRVGMSHPDPANAAWYTNDDISGRPRGGSGTEYEEHGTWRHAMNQVFSPQKLAAASTGTEATASRLIEALDGVVHPVDINARFSIPLCLAVILQVLELPDDHLHLLMEWTEEGAVTGDVERSLKGMQALLGFASRLVRERRGGEGSDVISLLLRASAGTGAASDAGRVVKLIAGMLAFGRETPASALTAGIVALLRNPEQRELMLSDPRLVAGAVEETLRLFHPPAATPHGLLRYAHEDVTVGEYAIGKGDMILIDIAKANFDPRVFPDPDAFDVTRAPNPHLTFGSGFYMCNFAKLARIELTAALGTLFTTLPGIRFATEGGGLRYKTNLRTRAIEELAVTW